MNYNVKINKEIARVVKNFNQKVKRLESKGIKNVPKKISVKDVKENVYNRNDLRRELNRIKRFSRRGAEDVVMINGNPISRWEIRETGIQVATTKRAITRRLKGYGFQKINGKFNVGRYASDDVKTLVTQYKSLNTKTILSQKYSSDRKRRVEQAKKYSYRYSNQALFNLRESLKQMINLLGVSTEDKDFKEKLLKKLNQVNLNEFKKLYYADELINDFISQYDNWKNEVLNEDDAILLMERIYEKL